MTTVAWILALVGLAWWLVGSWSGLRTARRLSHCFVMDVPGRSEPLIITDAAINIIPTLAEKRDIVQNAIDLAHVLRFEGVRVAILAAVETVSDKMPSTIDAAALCKMADRGQITGAILDVDGGSSVGDAGRMDMAKGLG